MTYTLLKSDGLNTIILHKPGSTILKTAEKLIRSFEKQETITFEEVNLYTKFKRHLKTLQEKQNIPIDLIGYYVPFINENNELLLFEFHPKEEE